ncbi:MAG TPA: DUF4296 domain-containing protein [Ignavibacteriaceae bacterium]|nr:DUF4296 domain-containing protein [Ignavibacteriaceae bacterium]
MRIILLYIFLAFTFSACNQKPPIEEEKFINIYVDIAIAQDTAQSSMEDIKKIIFNKYKVSSKEYNSTIQFYEDNPELWQGFFDKALERINEKAKKS